MGAPAPQTSLKIKNKRFKPSLLPAFREQQGGKEKRQAWGLFAPNPPTRISVGRNGHDGTADASPDPLLRSLDPISLAQRMFDTTQPGQLRILRDGH